MLRSLAKISYETQDSQTLPEFPQYFFIHICLKQYFCFRSNKKRSSPEQLHVKKTQSQYHMNSFFKNRENEGQSNKIKCLVSLTNTTDGIVNYVQTCVISAQTYNMAGFRNMLTMFGVFRSINSRCSWS